MKIHFGYLLGLAALTIAGCAAFFSVYGISQLFAGATTAVIVMASALEFGKLVAASYLQRYWKKINLLMKVYVSIGVTVLIIITSAGIYGFLSSAYQKTYQKMAITQNEISFLKQKEKFYADDVARYETELTRISSNIATLSNTKTNEIQVRDAKSTTGFRNTISTSGLRLAQERINVEEENRKDIMSKRSVVSDSLQKYQLAILDKENNSEVTAELGPLTYISKLTGLGMDKVVNYFILLLIFVFDPLAITLVLATNWVFQLEAEKLRDKKKDEYDSLKMDSSNSIWEPEENIVTGTENEIKAESEPEVIKKSMLNNLKRFFSKKQVPTEAEIEPEIIIEPAKAVETPIGARTILQSGFSTATPEPAPEPTPEPAPEPTPEPAQTQITAIKTGSISDEDINKIRQNQSRNFTRSIPARRGY